MDRYFGKLRSSLIIFISLFCLTGCLVDVSEIIVPNLAYIGETITFSIHGSGADNPSNSGPVGIILQIPEGTEVLKVSYTKVPCDGLTSTGELTPDSSIIAGYTHEPGYHLYGGIAPASNGGNCGQASIDLTVSLSVSAGTKPDTYFIKAAVGGYENGAWIHQNPLNAGTPVKDFSQISNKYKSNLISIFADSLDSWQLRYTLPQGRGILGITYGNGIFVAVGGDGDYPNSGQLILTSQDGITWSTKLSGTAFGTNHALSRVTYANGTFVAVSTGLILTSQDNGNTWQQQTSNYNYPCYAVTYGNGTFVAVSDYDIYASTDGGSTWTKRYGLSGGGGISNVYGGRVAYGDINGTGRFMALLSHWGNVSPSSENGIDWTSNVLSGIKATGSDIAYGNGRFMSLWYTVGLYGGNNYGSIKTSTDGATWTASYNYGQITGNNSLYAIAFGNGTFVAGGANGTIIDSTDNGNTWTLKSLGTGDNVSLLEYGNNTFVAVTGDKIFQSDPFCNYSISPITKPTFPSSGGTGSVDVTASASNCPWMATSNAPWITITSGSNGNGDGTVSYSVSANETGQTRTGTITIGDHTLTVIQAKSDFADVPSGYWAEKFIYSLYSADITSGCGAGNFCPEDPVTRAQMAVFIVKVLGQQPAATCTGTVFGDVNASMTGGEGFCRYIEKFKELNITAGCGNNNYCPDNPVTRAQMAVFILKALGQHPAATCTGTVFNDVNSSMTGGEGFCKYIEKFKELNITSGCGNGNYCPDNSVTRAQMAVFLTKGFLE